MKDKVTLYEVDFDLMCRECDHIGAIKHAGSYGIIEENDVDIYKTRYGVGNYHLSPALGFGGTIPYRCTNCGNVGLENCELEGYKNSFKRIR